jgi:hypothetical protein
LTGFAIARAGNPGLDDARRAGKEFRSCRSSGVAEGAGKISKSQP